MSLGSAAFSLSALIRGHTVRGSILAALAAVLKPQFGILTFAHASFYGVGAYATAILTVYAGLNWFPAMLLAFAIGGAVAFLIGIPTLRLGGDYFILALFGFSLIVTSLIINLEWLTNGPFGIRGIPRPSIAGFQVQSGFGMLAFIAVMAALNVAHELLSVKLGAGFDVGQAKRRISSIESQIDAAIAKQENLF